MRFPVHYAYLGQNRVLFVCLVWLKSLIFSHLPIFLTGSYKKINSGKTTALLVILFWPTQSWFAQVLHLAVGRPRILPHPPPPSLPWNQDLPHPNTKEMCLISVALSGGDSSPNSVTYQPLLYSLDYLKKIPSPIMGVFTKGFAHENNFNPLWPMAHHHISFIHQYQDTDLFNSTTAIEWAVLSQFCHLWTGYHISKLLHRVASPTCGW